MMKMYGETVFCSGAARGKETPSTRTIILMLTPRTARQSQKEYNRLTTNFMRILWMIGICNGIWKPPLSSNDCKTSWISDVQQRNGPAYKLFVEITLTFCLSSTLNNLFLLLTLRFACFSLAISSLHHDRWEWKQAGRKLNNLRNIWNFVQERNWRGRTDQTTIHTKHTNR